MNPIASDNSLFFPLNWGRNFSYTIHKGVDGIFSYRQKPVKYYGNGTPKIPTQVPGKNENCLWLVELLQLRSQIGSKIQDKEIECQKEWGKFFKQWQKWDHFTSCQGEENFWKIVYITIISVKNFLPPFNHFVEIGPNFFSPKNKNCQEAKQLHFLPFPACF